MPTRKPIRQSLQQQLTQHIQATTRGTSFNAGRYAVGRTRHAALTPYERAEDALAALRDPGVSGDSRNAIVVAFVIEAQGSSRGP